MNKNIEEDRKTREKKIINLPLYLYVAHKLGGEQS